MLQLVRGQRAQERAAELVVVRLVGLDDVAVERRSRKSPFASQKRMNSSLRTTASASRVNWPAATRSTVVWRPSR